MTGRSERRPGRSRSISSASTARSATSARTGRPPASPRQMVLGMPSNNLRLWDYIQFLRKVMRDKRFNADTLLAAIERRFPGRLSFFDRQFWRYAVIPQTKDGLRGGRRGLRVARQPPAVRARPRRHVQPAEATRGLRHGGRPHGGHGRLPLDLGTAHADRDVPALGRQQQQPARAEPFRRASGRRYGRLARHPSAQPDRRLAPRPSSARLSAGSHQRAARTPRARRSTTSSAPRATTSAARGSAR